MKHSNKERTGEEAAAESHSANTNRSSMSEVSEFTMRDVEHRMSGQYKAPGSIQQKAAIKYGCIHVCCRVSRK